MTMVLMTINNTKFLRANHNLSLSNCILQKTSSYVWTEPDEPTQRLLSSYVHQHESTNTRHYVQSQNDDYKM